ncbi:MFS transporter [Alkalihalophilus lindianensis]|uniref:MFS transporter n=1 Tax=Alkalihalophilus lindianensis TaxID=1630542 RepID=A0ABU3XD03_9BACI|nr:MFS transporter [Alkalihalophilus lindianensis]MDV2685765.1 MFS transporter [Alkalihalophilus lindianensis]
MSPTKEQKKAVTVVSLITALCLLGDSMLYVALPIYYQQVGLASLWEVGLILSINRFIRIPVNPIVGWAYRKLSLRVGLVISVILAVITTIGYGVGYGLVIWLVLRILWGIAWSFLRLGGFLLVVGISNDSNRGENIGRYNGLYRLGSLGGMLGGGILAAVIGFEWTAILFGISMLAGIPIVLHAIPKNVLTTSTDEPMIKQPNIKMKPAHKTVAVILSGMVIAFLIQGVFSSSISLVMADHFGDELFLIGLTVGVTALAGILQGVRWLWEPYLAKKFGEWSDGDRGRLPLYIGSLIVSMIGFLLIPIQFSIFIWVGLALILMTASTALTTIGDALTADVAKSGDANRVLTIYTVFLDVGAALGPLFIYGSLSIGLSLQQAFSLSAALFLLLVVYWVVAYRKVDFVY